MKLCYHGRLEYDFLVFFMPHGLPWAPTWNATWAAMGCHVGALVQLHGNSRGIPRHLRWAPAESHMLYSWMLMDDRVGCRGSPWASMGSAMGSHRNVK